MKSCYVNQSFAIVVAIFLLLQTGCQPTGKEKGAATVPALKENQALATAQPDAADISTENPSSAQDPERMEEQVKAYVPAGYELTAWASGDLNRDAFEDAVLIATKLGESEVADGDDELEPRPLLLLLGQADGSLKLAARNDHVALCDMCGGVFGDPLEGIAIKNGYFSIEHYGGSSWRWTRIITFKYDSEKENWFLHKDGGDSFHSGAPEEVETNIRTVKDFGVVPFEQFDFEKN